MDRAIEIPSDNPWFSFTTIGATLTVPRDCASKSIAIIVHGHAGHRDYCYQKELASVLSIPSVRFDFSGCGPQLGSGTTRGHEAEETPRTIESDIHDIRTVVRYARAQGYFVTALVGHSRGAVACFRYAEEDWTVPTVVNCSGRYRGHLIHEKVKRRIGRRDDEIGYWEKVRAGAGGPLVDKFMLLSEIASVGDQNMRGLARRVSPELNVLICFGTKDNVVPLADLGMFVNEFNGRATVAMLDDADHNFFVAADPLVKESVKMNKNPEVAAIIAEYLSEEATRVRFLKRHMDIIVPRFKHVEGLYNFRDLGGFEGFPMNNIFRSADMSSLTTDGAAQLAMYVDTIIDLRADPEVAVNGTIGPKSFTTSQEMTIPGITRHHVPIFKDIDYSPSGLNKFFGSQVSTEEHRMAGMVKAYKSILFNAKPVLATIFQQWAKHIRDHRQRGILIHCSAGKDRTGIICAVILLFGGVSEETVALEYELTTYGIQLQHEAEAANANGNDKEHEPTGEDLEDRNMVHKVGKGSNSETMRRAIRLLNAEFGGVRAYLQSCVDNNDLHDVEALLKASRLEDEKQEQARSKL